MKTHLDGFLDEEWIDEASGRYLAAMTLFGVTTIVAAPNQWLFPSLKRLRCAHQRAHQTQRGQAPAGAWESGPDRKTTRTQNKHHRRQAERNANRKERETAEARRAAETQAGDLEEYDDNPPPF